MDPASGVRSSERTAARVFPTKAALSSRVEFARPAPLLDDFGSPAHLLSTCQLQPRDFSSKGTRRLHAGGLCLVCNSFARAAQRLSVEETRGQTWRLHETKLRQSTPA